MNIPGGGKNDIPNRLKRQFAIFHVPPPSPAAINNIFGQLMDGRFQPDIFSQPVVAMAKRLVPLTMALWGRVQAKMLPTPAKFHYLFNMRDLSKVFQGVLLAQRDRFALPAAAAPGTAVPACFGGQIASPEGYLLGLWVHECRRVFGDKLATMEDKAWVDALLQELCQQVRLF